MIQIVGDILYCGNKYIVHQCFARLKLDNIANRAGQGLARELFRKYPYANIYSNRGANYEPSEHELPGNIIISGDGINQRFIINAIGQFYPSVPDENDPLDTKAKREEYFQSCLNKISEIENIESIAFPFGISCGISGGDWNNYFKMIELFSKKISKEQGAIVSIYKK